jgi:hypothetical protein
LQSGDKRTELKTAGNYEEGTRGSWQTMLCTASTFVSQEASTKAEQRSRVDGQQLIAEIRAVRAPPSVALELQDETSFPPGMRIYRQKFFGAPFHDKKDTR